MKMADIVKSRNAQNHAGPVKVPVFKCGNDCAWDSIPTMPIINRATASIDNAKSILSVIAKDTETYTDISGTTVTMVSKIGTEVYHDIVTVVGCTNTGFIVTIGDSEYTVRRSIVRFITGE